MNFPKRHHRANEYKEESILSGARRHFLSTGRTEGTRLEFRDTACFRTTITPEGGEGPVGWAVAEALVSHLRHVGATVGMVAAWWDGVRFSCRLGGLEFMIVITPSFEAQPLEWSLEVLPHSIWRFLLFLRPGALERVCQILDAFFAGDERFTLIEWNSLRALAKQRDEANKRVREKSRRE